MGRGKSLFARKLPARPWFRMCSARAGRFPVPGWTCFYASVLPVALSYFRGWLAWASAFDWGYAHIETQTNVPKPGNLRFGACLRTEAVKTW